MAFSLEAIFGVDGSGVRAEMKHLRRELNDFVTDYAKLGAGVAVGAFVALSKGAVDLAGRLSDTSQNIGINVESLQALEAQHKRNGVSGDQLTKALEKTKAAVIAASAGDEKAIASLTTLGLKAEDLIRLPLDRQYEAIARAAAGATDQNEAYAAVSAILGEKVGPKLMTSLRELASEGLDQVAASAAAAGHVMSAETIVALDRAGDAIDDFKKQATIAVGDIIMNFRSEEGLKLLGMKLMQVAGEFGGSILDLFTEAGTMAYAVLRGSFNGVLNYLQDGFVSVLQAVAEKINLLLPEKFEIDVASLDSLRSTGRGIGEEITAAIAQTSPSTFKKDFSESWGAAIQEQQKIVDNLNAVDLGPEANKLREAGDVAQGALDASAQRIAAAADEVANELMAGADAVAASGESAGESIVEAAEEAAAALQAVFQSIERTGSSYQDQSSVALEGVRDRLRSQRDTLQNDNSYSSAFAPGAKNPMLNFVATELLAVERELAQRREVQGYAARFGEEATRYRFGDTVTDRGLRDLQTTAERTNVALESIRTGLVSAKIIRPS